MSQPPTPSHEGDEEQRLRPRPIARPSVDSAAASAFGRPRGVEGSFDALSHPGSATGNGNAPGNGAAGPVLAPPTPESLAQAFGRPPGADDVVLQRADGTDGGETGAADTDEAPLWTSEADPWRDPGAPAVLGRPAVTGSDAGAEAATAPGAQLSLPEVLFGRRVKPAALAILAVIAVLLGGAGGLVGWAVATTGDELTGELDVAEADAAKERPAGSIAGIAKRVAPAVVSLEVTSGRSGGVGSGVMIDSDGYVLTNHHVVSQAAEADGADIAAVFIDGTRAGAEVVGTDPKTDLAVIKVNVSDPVVLEVGKSSDIAPGDGVVAVGSPFGLENTVTEGIVSAVGRPVTAPGENGDANVTYDAIQTDAAINPGNSGGALVDSRGALVGINSMIRTVGEGEGGSIGLGFAIPVDQAMRIAEDLISDGEVQHADIGVNAASVSAGSSEGAQVQHVQGQGPAGKAGVQEGDVITKVGERQVRNAAELTVAVREHEVGDTVPVRLVRSGRALTVDVTLGSD
ncbi:trypsin-like peptidase domain-containing protein [Prauserella halophila]|uniref:Trypsin-like peptidase domain-containing protein n=1 Tax=Prauserella halophila TaxID=185641 RepID=A0ABP4H0H4_9PSEU|nr:trypsin-like peptidase domain-containing protein [Prauserella halophila]MCP2238356.1 serine protease, S1-C subfamily, contains C-terminal PDZ domain [Prauserella halophila]